MWSRSSDGGHSRVSRLRAVSRRSSWSGDSVKSMSAPRKAQHPLGDDVALDLRRAAGDGAGEAHEEAVGPPALLLASVRVDHRAVRALELHPELEARFGELRRGHLHVRVLRRGAALRVAGEALVPEGTQA